MTLIKRVIERTVECNRCSVIVPADYGPRKLGKPVGWAHISYSVKPEFQTGQGPTDDRPKFHSMDLCPQCAKDFHAFMDADK